MPLHNYFCFKSRKRCVKSFDYHETFNLQRSSSFAIVTDPDDSSGMIFRPPSQRSSGMGERFSAPLFDTLELVFVVHCDIFCV